MTLSELAIEIARDYIGVHEEGGKNRGPEIDLMNAAVGQKPGQPWCWAFLYLVMAKAAAKLGMNNPLPPAYGSTLRAWRTAQPYMRDSNPQPGYIWVLQHSETTGHAGIVESINDIGVITSISGNTNEKGSREGTHVLRKTGQPEVVHGGVLLGYLDVNRGAQPALVA